MGKVLIFVPIILVWAGLGWSEPIVSQSPADQTSQDAKPAGGAGQFTKKADIVYGRKFGTALTLDVLTPTKNPRGVGVVVAVSAGWSSGPEIWNFYQPHANVLLERGYTVFAVFHGCQPKYTVIEANADIHRAVSFIRQHAQEYGIDPERIGVTGVSAGGHLSLMMGTTGKDGKKGAKDAVDAHSNRVQAVVAFAAPTDFLNYGVEGVQGFSGKDVLNPFLPAVDFHEFDKKTNLWERVNDPEKRTAMLKLISPAAHVTDKTAPTLLIHGEVDTLVPAQQAERMAERLKKAEVEHRLVLKKGAGHVWGTIGVDMAMGADWFDRFLAAQKSEKPGQ